MTGLAEILDADIVDSNHVCAISVRCSVKLGSDG